MHTKKASLLINPRAGENVTKLPDVLAVLAAAGWKTEIALKEYGKHIMDLANQASQGKKDLLIAYGGDGTLNQVVNGVMSAKGRRSVVGILPGGTANVWAGEIGVPTDPVKAALALINSEERKVDVGRLEVRNVIFPGAPAIPVDGNIKKKATKASDKIRHHFLLMAGLGIDAAIMGNVSKPLKYRVGPLAVGLSAAKELPTQRAYPIEIQTVGADKEEGQNWKGEALQVVVGNTRSYAKANSVELTPNAYINDGILDVCVITAGDPLTKMQQITSLVLRQRPDNNTAEFFQGAQLLITVPATVPFQLDGSVVKLKDYLSKQDYEKIQQVEDKEQVLITYQFDSIPQALEVAIPCTYNDELFEQTAMTDNHEHKGTATAKPRHSHQRAGELPETEMQHDTEAVESEPASKLKGDQDEQQVQRHADVMRKELPEFVNALIEHGRKVSVIAKVPNPAKKNTYVIAGCIHKESTGEMEPVALVVNSETTMFNREGAHVTDLHGAINELLEGAIVIVEGKKSKRGVIQATRFVL